MVHKFRTVQLSDLLSDCDLVQVQKFINTNDWEGLHVFLQSRDKELRKRGVIPDYLYYQIEFAVKRGQ